MITGVGQAAVWYAEQFHWPVFPCYSVENGRCTCPDRNCGRNAGKHPHTPHGFKDASADLAQIEQWWSRWPDSNIGLATGAPSGVDVVDIDPRAGGDETLWELERKYGEIPATVTSLTGGGGCHLLFAHTGGLKCGELAPGVDVKTTGGYIILPPSAHLSGRQYTWEGASQPNETVLAPWPAWLLDLARGRENGQGKSAPAVGDRIPTGRRNATLASLAGSMRRRGMGAEEILAALCTVNERRCDTPLSEAEVRRIAESIGRYPPNADPKHGPLIRCIADVRPVREYGAAGISWLWDGLLAEQAVTIWSGEAGCGKSTLACALAGAIATGVPLAGRSTSCRPVLILDRENPLAVTAERLQRLAVEDGDALKIWGGWLPEEPPAPAAPIVLSWVSACEPRPLIIVDSLIAFHTGSENDAAETRRFLASFRLLSNLGATVLALHHSGKTETAKDYRGSSDIKASVDSAYHLANLGDATRLESLRLRAFKTRFTATTELVLRYASGRFEADERGPRKGVTDLLRELLVANPGVRTKEFEELAARKDLGRNRARVFLLDSISSGRVRVDKGEHNSRFHTWTGGKNGLF